MHRKKHNKTVVLVLAGILLILIACAGALLISHRHVPGAGNDLPTTEEMERPCFWG